jgi:hypothetical protein
MPLKNILKTPSISGAKKPGFLGEDLIDSAQELKVDHKYLISVTVSLI